MSDMCVYNTYDINRFDVHVYVFVRRRIYVRLDALNDQFLSADYHKKLTTPQNS